MLWADAQEGKRSQLMVAKEFAGLLEGCSYLDPVIFDGDFMELDRAVEQAKSEDIRVCQLAGPRNEVLKLAYEKIGLSQGAPQTESFAKESWRLAGRANDWRFQYPLVFDQRNPDREAKLLQQLEPHGKRWILVAADSISSPFPHKELLMELLRLRFFRKYEIIDLSTIKAERFHDLLAIYTHPRTECLVAIDSAPLHLAYAVKDLPVCALIQDRPTLFFGSAWRPNHIYHCRYGDWTGRALEMLDSIANIRKPGTWFASHGDPKIIHVWSSYELNDENKARHQAAVETWKKAYEQSPMIGLKIEVGAVGRDSYTVFQDKKRFPYVKDIIRNACLRADDDDFIMLTRCDTCFTDRKICTFNGTDSDPLPCYSLRSDADNDPADMFCFTKKWWRENQNDYPDMIAGLDPFWHRALMEFIKLKGGQELKGVIYRGPGNVIAVEHTPYRGLNQSLFEAFNESHGIVRTKPQVSSQISTRFINSKALYPFGYNPSIIGWNGRILMAYRWHSTGTLGTTLAIAELDGDFNVRNNQPVVMNGNFDDPRLFVFKGQLWMAFVQTNYPKEMECCVVYGQLVESQKQWVLASSYRPNTPGNDMTGMMKNWVFFEYNQRLFCIYGSQPEQVVLELDRERVVAEHRSRGPTWPWGEVRGGALVPWNGKLLRFFHSRTNNDLPPVTWRYVVGASIMEPEPPFTTIDISKEPVIRGSEHDELTPEEKTRAFHWKPNVVFPAGLLQKDGNLWLSLGINDSACALAKVDQKDLKL